MARIESPFDVNTKHAVRCCRDPGTNEEDIWYPSPAAGCNVDTLEQRWTVSVLRYAFLSPALTPSSALTRTIETVQGEPREGFEVPYGVPFGYTHYPGRTCREGYDDEEGYSVPTVISITAQQECADLCDQNANCDSFDILTGVATFVGNINCFLHLFPIGYFHYHNLKQILY